MVLLCVRSKWSVGIVEWEQDDPKDDYKLVISTILVGWFCSSFLFIF